MKLQIAVAISLGLLSWQPAVGGENKRVERVEISGGVTATKLNAMWIAAKRKCYELDYVDIVEERELSTLICKQDNLNIRILFDSTGFTIKADAFFSKMPIIGGIPSGPRKHRRALIEAMQAAAGQKPTVTTDRSSK